MSKTGTDIQYAADLLRSGKVVSIPTETVYGLAANALDPEAVSSIFEIKQRPSFDPLIIHLSAIDQLSRYVLPYSEELAFLLEEYTPGPITILFKKKDIIPDLVTAGLDTVAVRFPSHPVTMELLDKLDFPLAAPSANPFGYISPTQASHVDDQLGDKVDYILDGGACVIGVESTIVSYQDNTLHVLRKGGMELEGLMKRFPNLSINQTSSSNPVAPGMLKSHYAPSAPVVLCEDIQAKLSEFKGQKVGILSLKERYNIEAPSCQKVLSPTGSLREASQNLFAAMRELDKMNLDIILTSLVPEEGLGRAINDRLRRAAAE